MKQYSIEPRTRQYVKGYRFLSFARKYKKQLLDTGLDALKSASKKLGHKSAEATGEFIGNKIVDKTVKPKHVIDENPGRKIGRNIKRIKTSIIKTEHYRILSY